MTDYSQLSQKNFEHKLLHACHGGNTDFINEVIHSDLINKVPGHSFCYHLTMAACSSGKLDVLKKLFESDLIKAKADLSSFFTEYLNSACEHGHLDIVQYLFSNLDIQKSQKELVASMGLTFAAQNGKVDIIEYLLNEFTGPNIQQHNLDNGALTNTACEYGQIDVIKFLHKKDILNKDNIHVHSDYHFETALENNQLETIRYFIFDLNINKTEDINQALKNKPNAEVERMFTLRDLNNHLNASLDANQVTNKKPKV